MIQLRVLGSTDLRGTGGQAVLSILAQPKRLTLLTYLALNATGRFVRRDKLLDLFWPLSEPAKARASLRSTLTFLRKSLGEDVVVTRGDDEVGIAAEALECDAVRYRAALHRGDREAALELYEGPLLDGVVLSDASLERWLEDERAPLLRQAVEAAASLADELEGQGDMPAALAWAQKEVLLEPHAELGVRRLMGLLARVGDRAEAVRTYEAFVAGLAEELDLEPAPETRALGESIRAWTDAGTHVDTQEAEAPTLVAVAPGPAPAPTAEGARRVARRPALAPVAVATTALAALVVLAALWGSFRPEPTGPVVSRYSVVFAQGEEIVGRPGGRFAISPDGSLFVYTGGPDRQLYLKRRDGLHARPLPGTQSAAWPFFSPDGDRIGFFVGDRLELASFQGGPVTTVASGLDWRGAAAWGPDESIYASALGFGGLVQFPASANATVRPFTSLDSVSGETQHQWPDVLPHGRGILFTVTYAGLAGSRRSLAVADRASGSHKILVTGYQGRYATSGHLVYVTEDRRLVAAPFDLTALELTGSPTVVGDNLRVGFGGRVEFALSASGTLSYATGPGLDTRELVWVTRKGVVEPVDPGWHANFSYPTLSPDGSRLAVVVSHQNGADVWVNHLDRNARFKLTAEGGVNGYPTWTPDGQSITYFRDTSGSVELWTKPSDGSGPPVLELSRPRELAESLWSPDRSWLIYRTTNVPLSVSSPGAADILAVQPGGDAEPTPLATSPYTEVAPALSPDGRWLAYASHESGKEEVYVVPFPDAHDARWSVSPDGGMEPVWSHGTSELFYRDLSGMLIAVEVQTLPTFSVGPSTALFDTRPFVLAGLHAMYTVGPDDDRFLMVRAGENDPGELIVVENWFQELSDPFVTR